MSVRSRIKEFEEIAKANETSNEKRNEASKSTPCKHTIYGANCQSFHTRLLTERYLGTFNVSEGPFQYHIMLGLAGRANWGSVLHESIMYDA